MGRRICPSGDVRPARAECRRVRMSQLATKAPLPSAWRSRALVAVVLCLALAGGLAADLAFNHAAAQSSAPSPAQSPAPAPSAGKPTDDSKTDNGKPQKMFVEASELVYNKDKNTVSAEGNARVYYKGSVLQADRIVYDRNTGRVYAEGNAQLRQPDGTLVHADRFDLTEDFRDGFIQSLRTDTTDRTHLSAPQAERTGGDITVYDKGTYTACDSCRENPDRPPLWRVRAKRIIHNNDEHMLYYQDAWMEFIGIPIAYVPFFSAPDPTVKRKSGILTPHYVYNPYLGFGLGVPIYWAMAPSYDLTVTPTYFSRQGFFGSAEWRQRFDNGTYSIRADGIIEQNPTAFPAAPYGAADRQARGEVETHGAFDISNHWKFGWDITALSDRYFLSDYGIPNQTVSANYFAEVISDLYLTGQGDRSYFDIRGYHFQGLAAQDFQPQQPLIRPVWDYNRTFDLDPARTAGIGGQLEFDYNLTSLSEQAASYQAVGPMEVDKAFGLHQICTNYVPGQCLLRGIGGDYTRLTSQLSWQRKVIDPLGGVWTPFAFARVNGEAVNLNTTDSFTFSSTNGSSTISNASQTNFVGAPDALYGEFMPGVGLEYRYPMISRMGFGSLTLEPIGQIIARPNQQLGSQSTINMDAQSLVFDDSTLFAWDKYSGYDRFETGVRANYGGQATFNFKNGAYINLVGGQSYQVAGTNSYAIPDAANVGLSSGLDTRASDYVAGLTVSPGSALTFIAKGRFDVSDFNPRRIDLITNYNLGAWTGSIQYANYDAQPLIGYPVRREGLSLGSTYKITNNYFVNGNITFDMSREFYPASQIGPVNPGPFAIATLGLGAGYQDECTTFKVNYINNYTVVGPTSLLRNQTVLVELQLRTLGGTKFMESVSNLVNQDNIK